MKPVTNLLYLARHSKDVDKIHQHLDAAEIELQRVAAITSQTLRFHKQATNPQEVTPEQLIQSVLLIYQGKIANSGVEISQRNRALKPVRCFQGEIRQVISNLVNNALDAMSVENGRLIRRTRLGTNWKDREAGVVITVADTGSGMSRQTLAKLFNPFFTTKGMTGSGFGLGSAEKSSTAIDDCSASAAAIRRHTTAPSLTYSSRSTPSSANSLDTLGATKLWIPHNLTLASLDWNHLVLRSNTIALPIESIHSYRIAVIRVRGRIT